MLLRRKADIAKINAVFRAQRIYGFVYGVRPYDGDEKGFSEKPFNNQTSFLCEYESWDALHRFMSTHFPHKWGEDMFVIGDAAPYDLPNPYRH